MTNYTNISNVSAQAQAAAQQQELYVTGLELPYVS